MIIAFQDVVAKMMKFVGFAIFVFCILFITCCTVCLTSCVKRLKIFHVDKTIPLDKLYFIVIKKHGRVTEQIPAESYRRISLCRGYYLFVLPRLRGCNVKIYRGLMTKYSVVQKNISTNNIQKSDSLPSKDLNYNCGIRYNTCCMICLEDFKPSDSLFHIPCGHSFHLDCAVQFFTKDGSPIASCPYCKSWIDNVHNSFDESTFLMSTNSDVTYRSV